MLGLTKDQKKLLKIDKDSGVYDKILTMYPDANTTVDAYLEAGKAYYIQKESLLKKDKERDYENYMSE